MNRPTRSIKIYVREKDKPVQIKLPKSLFTLFATAQLVFGLNFGFVDSSSKKIKNVVSIITIFMACVMLLIQVNFLVATGLQCWTIYFVVDYMSPSITLFFSKYSVSEFLSFIAMTPRNQIRDATISKLGAISWMYMTSICVMEIVTIFVFCLEQSITSSITLLIIFSAQIPWLGLNFIPVANCLTFYLIFVRMRNLKEELDRREINANQLHVTYKAIADSFEKLRKSYDIIVSSASKLDFVRYLPQ